MNASKTWMTAILTGLLLEVSGCASTPPLVRGAIALGPGTVGDDGSYRNKGFSMKFPAGWQFKEGVAGLVVMAVSPLEGPEDEFAENCGLAVEGLPEIVSLRAYEEAALEQIRRGSEGFYLQHEGRTSTFSGVDAMKIVYDQELDDLALRMQVHLMVRNEHAFILTCGTGKEVFSRHQEVFDAIAKSFRFETLH